MYGAILGDMVGSPYEFDRGDKTKDFQMWNSRVDFTDDSVMTIAVAEAMIGVWDKSDEEVKQALVSSMQKWGHKYPNAGYGGMFYKWLREKNPKPYGSFGNGSAMRVSSVGWLFDTVEKTRKYARLSAEVTHDHPEGIKGAEAIASAIFMARIGATKEEIKEYIIREFGYDLSRSCDEIRPDYYHVESCQQTVPEAITAFMEGESFEDVIRTAVSLGGDCDTLTCIAGSIAEAFYGIPEIEKIEVISRLPKDMMDVMERFDIAADRKQDGYVDGTVFSEVQRMAENERTEQNMFIVLEVLRDSFVWVPCNAIMSERDCVEIEESILEAGDDLDSLIGKEFTNKDFIRFAPDILKNGDDYFFPVFSTAEEMGEYGENFSKIQKPFLECIMMAKNNENDVKGIVVNAFSKPFVVTREIFSIVEKIPSRFEQEGDENE